jgi:hypothetical protein
VADYRIKVTSISVEGRAKLSDIFPAHYLLYTVKHLDGLSNLFNFFVFKFLSVNHIVQTGSGAHTSSYPMGAGALSPGVKR